MVAIDLSCLRPYKKPDDLAKLTVISESAQIVFSESPTPFIGMASILVIMAKNRNRTVNASQLIALILAFLFFSGLLGILGAGLFVPMASSAAVAAKTVPAIFEDLPSDLEIIRPAEESVMLDKTGAVIARFYDKQRIVVESDQIADTLKKAIVTIEDKRFYEHSGADATGISRAFISNLAGDSTQGASTITQQFVRNAMKERGHLEGDVDLVISATEQTPARKLREIRYALALEHRMSKDEILTGYLNIAPFGPITYGAEAASRRYFSKSAKDLTWVEAALLSGLVQSPVEYDPLRYPDAAQKRRDIVLTVMNREGLITDQELQEFTAIPVTDMLNPTIIHEGCQAADDSVAYFCSYVLDEFLADEAFGPTPSARLHTLQTGGLTIHTTMDPKKQQAARETLIKAIPIDDASDLDNALVSVEPRTGKVLAVAQNTNYGIEEGETMKSYGTAGYFQTGSIFKVFTLIHWYKSGNDAYTPVGSTNLLYPDGSFKCFGAVHHTTPWTVNDVGNKAGVIDSVRAVGNSVNQAFVNMASRSDLCGVFQTAADFGLTINGKPIEALPSNILGTAPLSPLQMATAYATIAADGQYCTPQPISLVTKSDQTVVKEYQPQCREAVSPDIARKVSTTIQLANQRFYQIRLAGNRPYAGKTGTTNDSSNTWMAGFTPEMATAVWVGTAKASSREIHNIQINGRYYGNLWGATIAGPQIWAPYMSAALEGEPARQLPQTFIGNPPKPKPRPQPEEAPETPAETPAEAPAEDGAGN